MRLQHIVLLALSLLLQPSVATSYDDQPSVGIHHASGHATISALLPNSNNSYIDIAKIEGSPLYKTYMQNPSRWLDPPPSTLPSIPCPLPSHLCTYWPFPPPPPPNPLEPILQTLLSVAEFTLSTPIHSAAVTVYDGVALTTQTEQHVQTALSKVGVHTYGLRHVMQHLIPALSIDSPCANPFHRPDDPDFKVEPHLLFSAEFTRDSLTALLWEEECGITDALGYVNSPRLGLDFLTACRKSGVADEFVGEICFRTLRASLRRVAREASFPPTRSKRHEPKPKPKLDSVLLYGESATHADIVEPLREVLSGEFVNGGEVDFFSREMREFAPEPAFAGSRAAAHAGRGAREWEREREVESAGEREGMGWWGRGL